jgi:hypothetical protein
VDGFKAYRYYLAIKLHFTTNDFDVFKNRGVVRGTREAFNSRNDRYIFEKLAKKYQDDKEIIQFFVANFAYGGDTAFYEGQEAEENFLKWTKNKQSITKIFIDDLAKIISHIETKRLSFAQAFSFLDNEYPVALKLFLGKEINIESLRIIDDFHPIVDAWSNHSSLKYIWEGEFRRIKKLTGFVKYDRIKLEKIFTVFMEEAAV